MDTTNSDRAFYAAIGITAYVDYKDYGGYEEEGLETHLCDFMSDLRHLCKQEGLCFERAVRVSLMHFEEECQEECNAD